MSSFSLEKLLDKETNKYRVAIIAAKRARVINETENDDKKTFAKVALQALQETLEKKVKIQNVESKPKAKK